MARKDWQSVCAQVLLGIVPCGSGNGLARSIAHLYDEPYDEQAVKHATFYCLAGHSAPMDIVRVQLDNGEVIFSFLSIGWGLIADIDIESERLRSLGAHRFTLWTIYRMLNLRTHKGRLTYLPYKADMFYDARDMEAQNENTQNSVFDNCDDSNSGWITEEGDFVMVHAAYTPFLSSDAFLAPEAHLNDGLIHLLIIRAGVSRRELLKSFTKLSEGTYLPTQPNKHFTMVTVTAFRLEPLGSEDGILAVDGERVHFGTIQAEIYPSVINAMVPPTLHQ